jgi:PAS domain S-box-containing protein
MFNSTPKTSSATDAPSPGRRGRFGLGCLRAILECWRGRRPDESDKLAEATRIAEIARRMPLAVITTDTEARITWANPAFLRLTEYTIDQVLGRRPADILQGPLTDRNESRRIGHAVRARQPITTELINYTATGRPYFVRIEIEPLVDDAGKHVGFMGI